jgi:cathepsin B
MKIAILLALVALAACHEHVSASTKKAFITKEHIAELKETASFEVADYESHPFKDMSIDEIKKRLGLMNRVVGNNRGIPFGNDDDLPKEFDSRTQWPSCVHPIRDQASCGSCWAFAASEVTSDRFCIASNGAVDVVLSPQDLVSCDSNDFGCDGGYIDKSWDYIRDHGIVSDACYPYTSGKGTTGTCKISENGLLQAAACVDSKVAYKKYKVKSHRQLTSIADAKADIIANGPIDTGFEVYSDFMSYTGGVYKKSKRAYLLGGHAVKIVGFGEDTDGTGFWIVANSWGTGWGEKGFFRIAFGQCSFEDELWAGLPDLESVNKTTGHHH